MVLEVKGTMTMYYTMVMSIASKQLATAHRSQKCSKGLPLVGRSPSATANPTTISTLQGAGARAMVQLSLQGRDRVVHTYEPTENKLHEEVAINQDLAWKLQLPISPYNVTVGTAVNGA